MKSGCEYTKVWGKVLNLAILRWKAAQRIYTLDPICIWQLYGVIVH
jgi:hypothetical protein